MLVDKAVKRWALAKQRADNTSVVTLLLDPPGPPKAQVLVMRFVGYFDEVFFPLQSCRNLQILVSQKQYICSKPIENPEVSLTERESIYSGHSYSRPHSTVITNPASSGVAIFTRYPAAGVNQSPTMIPLTKYPSPVALLNNENFNSNPKYVIFFPQYF